MPVLPLNVLPVHSIGQPCYQILVKLYESKNTRGEKKILLVLSVPFIRWSRERKSRSSAVSRTHCRVTRDKRICRSRLSIAACDTEEHPSSGDLGLVYPVEKHLALIICRRKDTLISLNPTAVLVDMQTRETFRQGEHLPLLRSD